MREMRRLTLRKSTRRAAGWFGAQFGRVHEPPLSRPSATLSPQGGERAGRGVPIWFIASIHVQFWEVFPHHEACPLILSFSPGGGEGAWRAVEWVHAKRPRLFRSAAGHRSQRL